MSDMLLILLVASVVIVLWAAYESRRYKRILAAEEAEEMEMSAESIDEMGASAVAMMTERVEAIMRRHRRDRCVAVALTEGCESGPGCSELHHLLPGDPVWIQKDEERPDFVNVFSAGYKVGSIGGDDARKALDILKDNELKATYVCQQDCYEYYDKVAVRLIIFYQPEGEVAASGSEGEVVYDGFAAREWLGGGAAAFVRETGGDRGLLDGAPYRLAPDTIAPSALN